MPVGNGIPSLIRVARENLTEKVALNKTSRRHWSMSCS